MIAVETAHTSSLDRATLTAIRTFLEDAFAEGFDHHDWDHALGGVHALAWETDDLVAHASVIQRRLLHSGRALRTGYVEAVAVRADRRRRGYGRAVMQRVNGLIQSAYDVGGLSAGEPAAGLYRSLGWQRWTGRTWVLGPGGVERTADEDGTTYVLPLQAELDLAGDLVCDWREGEAW